MEGHEVSGVGRKYDDVYASPQGVFTLGCWSCGSHSDSSSSRARFLDTNMSITTCGVKAAVLVVVAEVELWMAGVRAKDAQ